jgi:hypothetical protein
MTPVKGIISQKFAMLLLVPLKNGTDFFYGVQVPSFERQLADGTSVF